MITFKFAQYLFIAFIVTYGSGLIFFLAKGCHNPDSKLKFHKTLGWLISRRELVDNLAMFTLFHWFLTENLSNELVWISIDILFQLWSKDDKSQLQIFVDIIFILLSILLIIIKMALIWLFMLKYGKPSSKVFFLFDGILPSRVMYHCIHLLIYRAVLAIIVVLTDHVDLKIRLILVSLL